MYLLIHSRVLSKSYFFVLFTFHNVSINSQVVQSEIFCKYYLHSIMYLLIPIVILPPDATEIAFTFHNVSINSCRFSIAGEKLVSFTFHNVSINSSFSPSSLTPEGYLHSIMYLLILKFQISHNNVPVLFTFHNVSINSDLFWLFYTRQICIYIP